MATPSPFLKTAPSTEFDYTESMPQRAGGQDFGNRAKKFVSDLVFGKQVRIVKMDIDRYDRIVGMVYVGDVCVNESLVESGMAWPYRKYCKMEICGSRLELESMATDGDIGLWSHPNPVAPWDFRRYKRS